MPRIGFATLIAFVIVCSCGTTSRNDTAKKASATLSKNVQIQKTQSQRPKAAPRPRGITPKTIKAVWVDAWGPGFYDKAQCLELVQWCLNQGINTLLIEVRRTADAYYTSKFEPRGKIEESTQPLKAGFDPLKFLIEEAHDRHGLRVEAWIVANRIWKGQTPPPQTTPGHIANKYPDWLLINRNGRTHLEANASWYIDPSHPEARAYLAKLCVDVASRYRVDAIHLDYIRYPDQSWGYGPASLRRYRKSAKTKAFPAQDDQSFTDWRAAQVTLQVATIRQALKLDVKKCQLTVATVAWGKVPKADFKKSAGYRNACQDWPTWCAKGLIDFNYAMHYRDDSQESQAQAFAEWIPFLKQKIGDPKRLILGIGSYLNSLPGARRQISIALAAKTRGVALFSYRTPSRNGDPGVYGDLLRGKK